MKLLNQIFVLPLVCIIAPILLPAQTSSVDVEGMFQAGLESMDQYDYKQAAQFFYACQREQNDEPRYAYYLARAYEQLGNIQDARIFYKKAYSLDTTQAKYIMALGNIELQRQDYHSARIFFESLISLDSTNSYYYKQVGKSCYYSNDVPSAIRAFQYALYYNNRDLDAIGLLAGIYFENQEYDICLDWVRKGLHLDHKNPKFLNLKLKSEVKNENYEEAITTAEFMLAELDSAALTRKYYGIALCKTGEYEQSVKMLTPLLDFKEDEGIHYFLSEAYAALGEDEKSIQHLEDAAYRFGIGPMVWRYFYKLSGLYEKTGEMKEALRYMERSHDLHSSPLLVFQMARLTDIYYRDKRMAMNRYDQYLATDDSLFRDQAERRITEIKRYLHQAEGR